MAQISVNTILDLIESYRNGNISTFRASIKSISKRDLLHLAAVWENEGLKVGNLLSIYEG